MSAVISTPPPVTDLAAAKALEEYPALRPIDAGVELRFDHGRFELGGRREGAGQSPAGALDVALERKHVCAELRWNRPDPHAATIQSHW